MYFMKRGQKEITKENFELFRERCNKNAIFVDAWHPGTDDMEVPEEELLPGEISAFTFQVGCYTVRSAYRVYKSCNQDGCNSEMEKPAGKEDVEMVRKDLEWNSRLKGWTYKSLRSSLPSGLCPTRLTHEISAIHNSSYKRVFTYFCSTDAGPYISTSEYVKNICTIKENNTVPDERASLLVYIVYTGSSFGVDTWYKLDPDGKITRFIDHPFSQNVRQENPPFS